MEPEDKQDKIELVAGKLRFEMNNTLSRFNIKSIQIQSTSTPKNTIQLMMNLERLIQSFWTSVFIPSMCLILAAEITLFVDEIHFEATIMVNLTSSLVMYTLYNPIQEDLPADSSLKLIDLWLLHGILMPMVVFTILAINEIIESKQLKKNLRPEPSNIGATDEKQKSWIAKKKITIADNKNLTFIQTCKIIVPATSLIFMATFFGMGLSHQMENKD